MTQGVRRFPMARTLGLLGLGAAAIAVYLQARPAPIGSAQAPTRAPVRGYEIVRQYPHDPDAFTQGLLYRDGVLFESTGLNGRSSLRRVRLETGEVLQQVPVENEYFAEGLVDWEGSLVQLTWTTNVGFVYDLRSFERRRTFRYGGEGWGLTHDGRRLIMSDGTSNLRFLNPTTFEELSRVNVHDGGVSVDELNELEFVKGAVYANVWMTERVAIIDPNTGAVTAWLDLSGLRDLGGGPGSDVLNGIAYDAAGDRLFVTGKLWRTLFEIRPRLP